MRLNITPFRLIHVAALTLVVAGTSTAALAQNIFDDFSSGNDNAWSRIDAPSLFTGITSTYSVTNGQYRFQNPSYGLPFSLPTSAVRTDSYAADSQISVDIPDWNDNTNNVIYISARASQPTPSSFQFYALSFFPTSNAGNALSNLRIDRWNADGSIDSITAFDANAFPRVSNADAYRLVFTLSGTSLVGQLFDISGSSPTLVTTVSGVDSGAGSLSQGISGLGVYGNGTSGPADATFDNFRVIPAPGVAALVAASGLLTLRRRR